MSWKHHINYISQKVSRSVGIIAKLRHFIPRQPLLTIYKTLIDPYLNYGLCSWGYSAKTHLSRLLILQKRALRLINFSNVREHAVPLFVKARSLPLNFIYFERMCHMMHDIYNKTAPINLNNLFILRSELHYYKTRSALNQCFYSEYIKTEQKKRSFVSVGSKIWNGLPVSLKNLNKRQFKKQIKNLLFSILEKADDYIDFDELLKYIKQFQFP